MVKGYHDGHDHGLETTTGPIVLVGSPNVGKSALFNALTGAYATISNYPGTTVEVFRGKARIDGWDFEIVDTPGMYSLLPITEEEFVTRRLLTKERPDLVLHVVDAKNLERSLGLTLQLLEAGLPVLLILNVFDEARSLGLEIDLDRLRRELGIPVVATVGITGWGVDDLRKEVSQYHERKHDKTAV